MRIGVTDRSNTIVTIHASRIPKPQFNVFPIYLNIGNIVLKHSRRGDLLKYQYHERAPENLLSTKLTSGKVPLEKTINKEVCEQSQPKHDSGNDLVLYLSARISDNNELSTNSSHDGVDVVGYRAKKDALLSRWPQYLACKAVMSRTPVRRNVTTSDGVGRKTKRPITSKEQDAYYIILLFARQRYYSYSSNLLP
jgi:hypothetical protein